MSSVWDNIKFLENISLIRDGRRFEHSRLSYDCFKLKCKGNRAVCSEGAHLGQSSDGTLDLVTVLRGITPTVCKRCELFDGGD